MNPDTRLSTGIPGLDRLLRGGLRRGGLHLIAGPPGSGKTILAHQIASERARAGEHALYLTALVESHESLLLQATRFDFFDAGLVGKRFYYEGLYPALARGGLSAAQEEVTKTVREHRPALVAVDGLHVLQSTAPTAFEFTRFMNELQVVSSLGGATILAILNAERREAASAAFAMSDGIIRLDREWHGRTVIRTLTIEKLRASDPVTGSNVFRIDATGIRVFPRLEGIAPAEGIPTRTPAPRPMAFGIPGLDGMMGGGMPAGSVTMIAGVPGAGKTLTALSFLAAGAETGETGLLFGFHETPDRLVHKAERVDIPMRRAVDDGRVHMVWRPSAELLADELAHHMLSAIDRHGIERLVIDGLDDLRGALAIPGRAAPFLNVLTDLLRARGVGTVLTQPLSDIFALSFRLPLEEQAATSDNLLLLRYVELRARLHRLVSVLKMREQDFDPAIHEFTISSGGIDVADPLDPAEPLLAGFGRLIRPPGQEA